MGIEVAIVGSGPSGYYTAEALLKLLGADVRVDIIDRLPTPFGLIRAGVAPDHQSIKAVTRRYTDTSLDARVRFVGNVEVGADVSIGELCAAYHAVVLATGAPADRSLGIPGENLPGVFGSAAFVGWYNGHPDFADLPVPLDTRAACIIGNGNVALDVARILAKTTEELQDSDIVGHAHAALARAAIPEIRIIGRRGPHQVSFTPKELGEMGHLARAAVHARSGDFPPEAEDAGLDAGQRKVVGLLRGFATASPLPKPVAVHFDFMLRPVAIEGSHVVEALRLERTQLVAGRAEGTGEEVRVACGLVIGCIGYKTNPIAGVPYDASLGRFANVEGLIGGNLYCVGWAQRGPTGTIGTNRPDGFAIAERIRAEVAADQRGGGAVLDALIADRSIAAVGFTDWQKIDAAEIARARIGAPREKFVAVDAMLAAARQ